jgi:hypothetical protein
MKSSGTIWPFHGGIEHFAKARHFRLKLLPLVPILTLQGINFGEKWRNISLSALAAS